MLLELHQVPDRLKAYQMNIPPLGRVVGAGGKEENGYPLTI